MGVVAENCHDFSAGPTGELKCDEYLKSLKTNPEVVFNLLPRPQKRKLQDNETESPHWEKKLKGNPKGKGKGKNKSKKAPMPKC